MTRVAAVLIALVAMPAHAQQQPPIDPATLQRAITVLQQQRNQAMDSQVNSEVQRAALAEEVERLKAKIAEIEKGK